MCIYVSLVQCIQEEGHYYVDYGSQILPEHSQNNILLWYVKLHTYFDAITEVILWKLNLVLVKCFQIRTKLKGVQNKTDCKNANHRHLTMQTFANPCDSTVLALPTSWHY